MCIFGPTLTLSESFWEAYQWERADFENIVKRMEMERQAERNKQHKVKKEKVAEATDQVASRKTS